MNLFKSMLCGATCAVAAVFIFAILFALLYRFPFPMTGSYGDWEAAIRAPQGAHFYMLLGGYAVFPALGALGGVIAHILSRTKGVSACRRAVIIALSIDFVAVLILSTWDKIHGPW